ncbi:MAG: hypothetical protein RLW87_20585 [Alphaproteobacteria bacterium]
MQLRTPPTMSEHEFSQIRDRLDLNRRSTDRQAMWFTIGLFVLAPILFGVLLYIFNDNITLKLIYGMGGFFFLVSGVGYFQRKRDQDRAFISRLKELGVVDRDGFLNVDWRNPSWRSD